MTAQGAVTFNWLTVGNPGNYVSFLDSMRFVNWLYPTQSDSAPTLALADANGDVTNPGANVANYYFGADWNSLRAGIYSRYI